MQKQDGKDEVDELLINAIPIIEGLLKADKPELDWKISEYLCKDEVIHLFLSYISRLPSNINIKEMHKINNNTEWIKRTLKTTNSNAIYIDKDRDKDDHDRHFLIKTEKNNISSIYSKNDDIDCDIEYFEKLSFSLMKILCNGYAPKQLQSFLLRKIDVIVFHSLLVFHPLSFGNIYHSSQILNILLEYWPLQLYQTLTTSNCIAIQYLFKYAITSRIHQWKFGEFFVRLLCKEGQNINKYRKILIDQMLIQWHFIQNTIKIATNPIVYGDEISNKYCLFITNLLKECAKIKGTQTLFSSPNNMLSVIIDKLFKNLCDKTSNMNEWHKINCAMTLKEIIKYVSKPSILTIIENPKSRGIIAQISSENSLFSLFEEALKKFEEYIPLIIGEIICDVTDVCDYTKPQKIGLIKLNCFELLILYIDIIKIQNENFKIPNMQLLCNSLLNMTFIHSENNIFLSKFRAFMSVMNTYCVHDLKYMVIECKMVDKFMQYYHNKDVIHCALHAYIYQILYDIYIYHDELKMIDDQELEMMQDEEEETQIKKEWNFANYIELEEQIHLKEFIQIIQQEIELHEPDEDI